MGRFPRPCTAGGRSNGPARWRRWPGQRSCRATRRARAYPRTPLAVIRLALYSTLRVTPITPIRVAPKKLPSPLSNRLNADSSRNSHALPLTWRPFAPHCGVLIRPYLEPARIGLLGSRRFPIQRPTRAALGRPVDLQRRGSAPRRRPAALSSSPIAPLSAPPPPGRIAAWITARIHPDPRDTPSQTVNVRPRWEHGC